jgi:hypothetical protein
VSDMSLYDPLRQRLFSVRENSLMLSFEDIEGLIGQALPKSAHEYGAWWSNEDPDKTTHTQSKAWTTAGFVAEVDRARRQVTFVRSR